MTGLTPHRTIRRLRALGRTFLALGASLLLVAALAPLAVAQGNSPAAECGDLVFLAKFNQDFQLEEGDGTGISFGSFLQKPAPDDDETIGFTWSSVTKIGRIVTKAGQVSDVVGGEMNGGTVLMEKEISHITFCLPPPPAPLVVETPTPSETPTPRETPPPRETPNRTPTPEPTQQATPTEEPTVRGVVIERPPTPAAPIDPPAGEPEPAPEVRGVTDELPTTGPEDLWLAGLALMLLGAGLLTVARGKAMDATATAAGTWWTNQRP